MGQESVCGLALSSDSGLLTGYNQGVRWGCGLIQRFAWDWGSASKLTLVVVGRIFSSQVVDLRASALCWLLACFFTPWASPEGAYNMAAGFLSVSSWRGKRCEKGWTPWGWICSTPISGVTFITFTVFYLLETSNQVQPTLKEELTQGHNTRMVVILEAARHTTSDEILESC